MGQGLTVEPGGSPQISASSGSGATQAVDLASIAPAADGHVCSIQRPFIECISAGIAVRITNQGSLGDGLTLGVSTLVGGLKVRNLDTGDDMSDLLPICDHTKGVLGPQIGSVLILHGKTKDVRAQIGQKIALVWVQTGSPLDGTVPQFQILRFPLISPSGGSL